MQGACCLPLGALLMATDPRPARAEGTELFAPTWEPPLTPCRSLCSAAVTRMQRSWCLADHISHTWPRAYRGMLQVQLDQSRLQKLWHTGVAPPEGLLQPSADRSCTAASGMCCPKGPSPAL